MLLQELIQEAILIEHCDNQSRNTKGVMDLTNPLTRSPARPRSWSGTTIQKNMVWRGIVEKFDFTQLYISAHGGRRKPKELFEFELVEECIRLTPRGQELLINRIGSA